MKSIVVFVTLLSACGYGSDQSTLGDLVEHGALGAHLTYRNDQTLLVFLSNRTQSGACLGIASQLTATLNGQPGQLFAGDPGEGGIDGHPESCPSLSFGHVDQLGDPLTLQLSDVAHPAATATVIVHNPSADRLIPDGSSEQRDPDTGLSVLHFTTRDRLAYALPPGERFDDISYDLRPGSSGDARNDGDAFSFPLDGVPTGTQVWLELFAFTTADVETCVGAACSMSLYRYLGGPLQLD